MEEAVDWETFLLTPVGAMADSSRELVSDAVVAVTKKLLPNILGNGIRCYLQNIRHIWVVVYLNNRADSLARMVFPLLWSNFLLCTPHHKS